MSKIKKQFNEGDDVEIIQIKQNHELGPKYWTVPFVNEVEEFNETMGKPNNYKPTIPSKKEWQFVYDFILEELEEYKEAHEKVGDRFVVYRSRDRKVMKSINYFKPNLEQFLKEDKSTTQEDFDNAPFGD